MLFIDEAYQLDHKNNREGARIVNALITAMENMRGELMVVVAGYKADMDDFFTFNVGLPGRIPTVLLRPKALLP